MEERLGVLLKKPRRHPRYYLLLLTNPNHYHYHHYHYDAPSLWMLYRRAVV